MLDNSAVEAAAAATERKQRLSSGDSNRGDGDCDGGGGAGDGGGGGGKGGGSKGGGPDGGDPSLARAATKATVRVRVVDQTMVIHLARAVAHRGSDFSIRLLRRSLWPPLLLGSGPLPHGAILGYERVERRRSSHHKPDAPLKQHCAS
jgi:hypothetical protein